MGWACAASHVSSLHGGSWRRVVLTVDGTGHEVVPGWRGSERERRKLASLLKLLKLKVLGMSGLISGVGELGCLCCSSMGDHVASSRCPAGVDMDDLLVSF